MPFSLANALLLFQHYINDTLRDYLNIFCTVYIDDILIYSNFWEEHTAHVKKILECLWIAGLQINISKCEFNVTEVYYLGMIITTDSICMNSQKVQAVVNWETSICVKDIQAFIDFANFYQRFVQGFSKVVAPLIALVRKDVLLKWTEECQKFFELLKKRFTTALILAHFDSTKKLIVETDASDWVSAEILSQYSDDNIFCPVTFFSKKHLVQEVNYEIYDKELLVIICAFEEWWPELEGSAFSLKVITDHQNLKYFMSTKQLFCHQAQWSEFLSRFNFKIVYQPEKQEAKSDALTRQSEDLLKGGDIRLQQQSQVILKLHNLELMTNSVQNNDLEDNIYSENNAEEEELTLKQLFEEGHQWDPFPHKVLQQLHDSEQCFKEITLSECTEVNEQLHYRGCVYVSDHHSL